MVSLIEGWKDTAFFLAKAVPGVIKIPFEGEGGWAGVGISNAGGGRFVFDDDDGSKRLSLGEILNGIGSKPLEFLKGLVDAKTSFCSGGDGSFFFSLSSLTAVAFLLDLGETFFLRAGRSRGFGGAGVPHTTVRSAFKAKIGAGVGGGCMSSMEISSSEDMSV